MCLAMEKKQEIDEINGAIKTLKKLELTDKEIVQTLTKTFDITKEDAKQLLEPQTLN